MALSGPASVKVFAMNDCDWWAGRSLDETSAAYAKEMNEQVADVCDDPHELSESDMQQMMFVEDVGENSQPITFASQLKIMIERGDSFPCFFASTEY